MFIEIVFNCLTSFPHYFKREREKIQIFKVQFQLYRYFFDNNVGRFVSRSDCCFICNLKTHTTELFHGIYRKICVFSYGVRLRNIHLRADNTVVRSARPDENCFKISEFMAPLKCDALCRLPLYTCTRDLIMVKIRKKTVSSR